MTLHESTVWCDGCGVEILWAALIVDERHYCCENCLEGLPCTCGERQEFDEERRAASGAPAGAAAGMLAN